MLQIHTKTNVGKNSQCSAWHRVTCNLKQLLLQLPPFGPHEKALLHPGQYVLKTQDVSIRCHNGLWAVPLQMLVKDTFLACREI